MDGRRYADRDYSLSGIVTVNTVSNTELKSTVNTVSNAKTKSNVSTASSAKMKSNVSTTKRLEYYLEEATRA